MGYTMLPHVLNIDGARDLSSVVLESPGRPRVMSSDFYHGTSQTERSMLCVRAGIYSLPTKELVDFVRKEIGDRRAIEIGAGHGGFAAALGIPATDSRMQEHPSIAEHYRALQQQPVIYGENVERLDAAAALSAHKPQVVVACWVTHLYREDRPQAEGNAFGVNEEAILDNCESYIFIGNEKVHRGKSIWSRPHRIFYPDWLFSRAMNGSRDFIAVWGK